MQEIHRIIIIIITNSNLQRAMYPCSKAITL